MHLILAVILLPFVAGQNVNNADGTKENYYSLYDTLFADKAYKKQVRPAMSLNDPVLVFMEFYLLSLNEVDEKQQTLVTSARLQMTWEDDYLSWNSTDFGEITSMLVPQKILYLPDVVLSNSVSAQEHIGYDELPVRLQNDGMVEWEPTLITSTDCDIDITFFPFDTQKCTIDFATAVANNIEVDLAIESGTSKMNLVDFSKNGQWDLVDTKAENLGKDGFKSKIRFTLLLVRRRTFYLMNIILPVFFLSLTASLVFALPADEGEKMGTSITVLLAFAVYLSIVSDIVPNTSLQVSILGLYLTILLGLCSFSTIICVYILRIHFRDPESPVGPRVTKCIKMLRAMLCFAKSNGNQIKPTDTNNKSVEDPDPNAGQRLPPIRREMEGENPVKKPVGSRLSVNSDSSSSETLTWQTVAYTLDFFCFIFFTLCVIFTTLFCLLYLHFGSTINAQSL